MDAGLAAAATGERLADACADVEPGVGDAAAAGDVVTGVGVSVRVPVADGVGVGVAVVGATGAEVVGAGDAPDSIAHARESKTPGAAPQTDLVGVIQELPSAAIRESDSRMNG